MCELENYFRGRIKITGVVRGAEPYNSLYKNKKKQGSPRVINVFCCVPRFKMYISGHVIPLLNSDSGEMQPDLSHGRCKLLICATNDTYNKMLIQRQYT